MTITFPCRLMAGESNKRKPLTGKALYAGRSGYPYALIESGIRIAGRSFNSLVRPQPDGKSGRYSVLDA